MPNSESTLVDLIRTSKAVIKKNEEENARRQEFVQGLEAELEEVRRKRVSESSGDTRTLLNG